MTKKEFLMIQRKINTTRLEVNEKLEELQEFVNRLDQATEEEPVASSEEPPF